KQIQLQEQIEAKRKAEEQKKLDSIKNASKKPKEKKNKNKRHSLLEDKFYRVMKMQNSGFVNLNPQSTQYGNTRFKPQKIS
ncbi:MAG: hypothetical protein NTV88_02795, partial [Candidatus Micrarchaeota archaeon]|nr:hypothetical protein [Candidatus Micrarchaeota archaeon]